MYKDKARKVDMVLLRRKVALGQPFNLLPPETLFFKRFISDLTFNVWDPLC